MSSTPGHAPALWRTVVADLRSNVDHTRKAPLAYWLTLIAKSVISPQVHAVVAFRLGHAFSRLRLAPIGLAIKVVSLWMTGAEIHPAARIGPGFCLVHTSGVVIGHRVVIGTNCRMHQGVTLGEPGRGSRLKLLSPTVGNDVTIGAHAVIVGPVAIGDGAVIGANSVVVSDVPAHAVVGGVPAKVIRHQAAE